MPPPLRALVGIRAAIGLSAWVAPRLAGRAFGLDPAGNPQLPYVGRLFAARDLMMAGGLLASEGPSRRLWLQGGLAVDLADAAAAVLAWRRGDVGPVTGVLILTPALVGAGLGVAALQADVPTPAERAAEKVASVATTTAPEPAPVGAA